MLLDYLRNKKENPRKTEANALNTGRVLPINLQQVCDLEITFNFALTFTSPWITVLIYALTM